MSGQWHGGKGSSPRKMSVSQDEWENRWNAIFARDLPADAPPTEDTAQGQINTAPEKAPKNNDLIVQ